MRYNYDLQRAKQKVGGSHFDLILIAAQRARELSRGGWTRTREKHGPVVTAIKEIEAGEVGREYLEKLRR
jgi:DNA-directed RNA polymerase omega subunit